MSVSPFHSSPSPPLCSDGEFLNVGRLGMEDGQTKWVSVTGMFSF